MSEVTSRSSGSPCSFLTTCAPYSASSAGSASSSVYWYCVALVRVSICRSCTGWRKSWMPSTCCNFGCSREMISCASALRALAVHHPRERDVGRGGRDADDQAGVLLREEAFRHDPGEKEGEEKRADGDRQRQRL